MYEENCVLFKLMPLRLFHIKSAWCQNKCSKNVVILWSNPEMRRAQKNGDQKKRETGRVMR